MLTFRENKFKVSHRTQSEAECWVTWKTLNNRGQLAGTHNQMVMREGPINSNDG